MDLEKEFNHQKGYSPCSYVDNGGIRRESFTWFSTEEEAKEYFKGKDVVWPVSEVK